MAVKHQRIPILGTFAIVKSKTKAIPFLLYLKIRAYLVEHKGKGGEFWMNEEFANKFGMNLRSFKSSIKRGKQYGWYRKCQYKKGRYEIVSIQQFTKEYYSTSNTPSQYIHTSILPTEFINSITWMNISELRRYLAELVTDVNIRKTNNYKLKKEYSKVKSKKLKKSIAVYKKQTDYYNSISFQASILEMSKSVVWSYRQVSKTKSLPIDVSYSYKQDVIAEFGQHHDWTTSKIDQMNKIQEEGIDIPIEERGRYYSTNLGTILFNHVSIRKSEGILEIKKTRLRNKYYNKALSYINSI